MKFCVTGLDRKDGHEIQFVFESRDAKAAFEYADSRGVEVKTLNVLASAPAVPPPLNIPRGSAAPTAPRVLDEKRRSVRWWAVFLLVVAAAGAAINPLVGYWTGSLLLALVVLRFVPGFVGLSGSVLAISKGRPVATTLKMIWVTGLGLSFIVLGLSVASARVEMLRIHDEQVKRQIEQAARLKEATAKVYQLVADARASLQANQVDVASTKLAEAAAVPNAPVVDECRQLINWIALSKSPALVRKRVVELTDEQFRSLVGTRQLPPSLDSKIPVLNQAISTLAVPMFEEVKVERLATAKKQAAEAEMRRRDAIILAEQERKKRDEDAAKALAQAASQAAAERAKALATPDKIGAWGMAKQFVTKRLKAPSTADFGSIFGDYQRPDQCVSFLGNGKYSVRGWVDAQNSFGAKIRNQFQCEIESADGENWICTSITIE